MDPRHLALLRIHDACRSMSLEEIEAIALEVDVVHLGAGQALHRVGETIDSVYIVVEGRLKVTAKTPTGGERTIRYICAGDQFGALMLFSDGDDAAPFLFFALLCLAGGVTVLLGLPRSKPV